MGKQCCMCELPATIACPSCNQVWYCDKQHAKDHAIVHKNDCKPYKMVSTPEIGRYLVATKTILPGDIVLKDKAAIVAPGPLSENVCLSCHAVFAKPFICRECQSTLCKKACKDSPEHQAECSYFARVVEKFAADPNQAKGFRLAALVMPLRCLRLREIPEKWETFLQLEAHVEERKKTPMWGFVERHIVPYIRIMLGEEDLDAELVQRVCAIVDVNVFEVRIPSIHMLPSHNSSNWFPNNNILRGVYLHASMMCHSCVPNTELAIAPDQSLMIRARVKITEGTPITVTYTDPLHTTQQRREFLQRGKYFTCRCKRCLDPTESGTYISAIRCPNCADGYILPHAENEPIRWICDKCNQETNEDVARRSEEVVRNIMKNIQQLPIDRHLLDRCEELFTTLPKKLHPNHSVLTFLRLHLLRLYGNVPGYLIPELSTNLLNRKIQLCCELLDIFKPIIRGVSRLRGIVLHEYHAPLVVLASKKFETGRSSVAILSCELKEAERILKEAVEILIHEPAGTPESDIAKAAMADLKQLRDYIRDVAQLENSNFV